ELPVEGETGTRWLFKVDVLRGAPGSGALYRTGHFDGTRFVSDANEDWRVADWGNDFYAAIAWHEPRDAAGRPAWIGWIGNHAYQGQLPRQGWRGAMSTPRRLSLVRTGEELVLRQEVEPALVPQVPLADASAAQALFAARLIQPGGADFALAIRDGEGRAVQVTRQGARLVLERTDPQSPFLDGSWQAEADPADPVEIWIDGGSLEVLAGRGCAALTVQHRLSGAEYRLERAEPAAASAA
ncbi:MAG TPA: hypothetical protein VFV30_00075, partial [Novosphingobium sp.]|nr:hypothetical protein [Novosphingobium sp.]